MNHKPYRIFSVSASYIFVFNDDLSSASSPHNVGIPMQEHKGAFKMVRVVDIISVMGSIYYMAIYCFPNLH